MQYIKVYTMPVWYIAVYAGISRYENLIPGYTGIYLDVRNRMVLSRWWGFQMGPPVGGRPHSTGPGGAGVREATGDGMR